MKPRNLKHAAPLAAIACTLVLFSSGCSQPSSPIVKSNDGKAYYSIVPDDPQNTWTQYVAEVHNGGLDYLGERLNPLWFNNQSYISTAEDTLYNFVSDSCFTFTNITYNTLIDTTESFGTKHTMLQSDSIQYANDSITLAEKIYLDQIAKLFDSVDIYDSSTLIGRVIQIETNINSDTLTSSEDNYLLMTAAVGKASYYYWTAVQKNPLSPWYPAISMTERKKMQPLSGSAHAHPLASATDIIGADLNGFGEGIASNLVVTVTFAITGIGAPVALGEGLATALGTALGQSAWYAFWN
ncbi:MAG TPA: hypothetical protein VFH95_00505 [Candidatus Kapabacteria bacterium]|nr:hypothetical protein [Candidatus Kapabacteria bacterium]